MQPSALFWVYVLNMDCNHSSPSGRLTPNTCSHHQKVIIYNIYVHQKIRAAPVACAIMKVVSKFSWIPMIPDSESSDTFWAGNLVCKMRGGAGRRRQSFKELWTVRKQNHHSLEFGGATFLFNLRESQRHWILPKNQQKNPVQPTKFSHDHPTNRKHLACFREGTWQSDSQESDVHSEMIGVDIAPQRSPDIEKHPYSMKLFNKNTSTKKWRHSMFD